MILFSPDNATRETLRQHNTEGSSLLKTKLLMAIACMIGVLSVTCAAEAGSLECQKAFAREGQALNTVWHDGVTDCLNRIIGSGPTSGTQTFCANKYTAMETQRGLGIARIRNACADVTDIDELGGPICGKAHIESAIFCVLDDAKAHAQEAALMQYSDPCETLGLVNMEAALLGDYCPTN